jgi:hypothetical protein
LTASGTARGRTAVRAATGILYAPVTPPSSPSRGAQGRPTR